MSATSEPRPSANAIKDKMISTDLLEGDSTPDRFSLVKLRDRVVIMLLFDQIVQEDQVALAWELWRQMDAKGHKEPLWRVLAAFPDMDRELIFAEAARVYGFEEARISHTKARAHIEGIKQRIDPVLWEKMVNLRVMPIGEMEQAHSSRQRTVFVTHDPTHPDVQKLMQHFNVNGYELRYATEALILELLVETFPHNKEYSKLVAGKNQSQSAMQAYLQLEAAAGDVHVVFEGYAKPPKKQNEELDRSSLLGLFENVLEEAVREQASDICMLPNADGKVEIYLQVKRQLKRLPLGGKAEPEALMSMIKREIIRFDLTKRGEVQKRLIQRWINDELVRFRVTALPAGQDLHAECIVIRVLR